MVVRKQGANIMKIGDRVEINEPRHPLFNYKGMVAGFRGQREPGDRWVLVLVDLKNRSYLIPESMVKTLIEKND